MLIDEIFELNSWVQLDCYVIFGTFCWVIIILCL